MVTTEQDLSNIPCFLIQNEFKLFLAGKLRARKIYNLLTEHNKFEKQ
jgi:hypothetical protein